MEHGGTDAHEQKCQKAHQVPSFKSPLKWFRWMLWKILPFLSHLEGCVDAPDWRYDHGQVGHSVPELSDVPAHLRVSKDCCPSMNQDFICAFWISNATFWMDFHLSKPNESDIFLPRSSAHTNQGLLLCLPSNHHSWGQSPVETFFSWCLSFGSIFHSSLSMLLSAQRA